MWESVTTNTETVQITIDENSGSPIWLQLRNRLIYLITSGSYAVGDKLPTMREMAVELGINYNTVSKVYQDIERDGYIVSKRGPRNLRARRVSGRRGIGLQRGRLAGGIRSIQQCRELGVPRRDIMELVERRLRATEG